ncbi:hypothetical protein [Sphingobium sp. EM0848]|uniref:hypothetical protein n=1 Tax=Sphingobium sp. EM0848 TaxID=2743473 RepID=UPI00159C904F|nr:hypothetical protein [Sphingobium sp. EM0848]
MVGEQARKRESLRDQPVLIPYRFEKFGYRFSLFCQMGTRATKQPCETPDIYSDIILTSQWSMPIPSQYAWGGIWSLSNDSKEWS